MNVKELKALIADLPDETPVAVSFDDSPEFATELDNGKVEQRVNLDADEIALAPVLVLSYGDGPAYATSEDA